MFCDIRYLGFRRWCVLKVAEGSIRDGGNEACRVALCGSVEVGMVERDTFGKALARLFVMQVESFLDGMGE